MKRFSLVAVTLVLLAAISAAAAPTSSTANVPVFPGILANARYVYVASYDGDQFDQNLFPKIGTRSARCRTHSKVDKLVIVYRPSEADMIILVTSRSSEDLMAVYDAHPWPSGIIFGVSWDATVSSPAKFAGHAI